MQGEGVIKYDLRYTYTPPETPPPLAALNAWRSRLWRLQLIGRQAGRYGGIGYGNVSCRTGPLNAPEGHRQFIISGSQTGQLAQLHARHYSVVTGWDLQLNRVIAQGPIRPSSESLTHGMLYDQDDDVRVIFHVHSPAIWQASSRLGLQHTDPAAAYGTPEMAGEVARLFREADVKQTRIFTMGGHEDGVIAFGTDPQAAGTVLVETLVHSQEQ
jgi:ribulose-5-phosphate 4-epimerase/fuculose-1-phosphate aldolase